MDGFYVVDESIPGRLADRSESCVHNVSDVPSPTLRSQRLQATPSETRHRRKRTYCVSGPGAFEALQSCESFRTYRRDAKLGYSLCKAGTLTDSKRSNACLRHIKML